MNLANAWLVLLSAMILLFVLKIAGVIMVTPIVSAVVFSCLSVLSFMKNQPTFGIVWAVFAGYFVWIAGFGI